MPVSLVLISESASSSITNHQRRRPRNAGLCGLALPVYCSL